MRHPDDFEELAPLQRGIDVGGERFVLREMAGADLQRYVKLQMRGAQAAVLAIRRLIRPTDAGRAVERAQAALEDARDRPDEERLAAFLAAVHPRELDAAAVEAAIESAVDATANGSNDLFCWLLDRPEEWVREHLNRSARKRILAIQDELNGMDELSKNVEPLLLSIV